MLTIVSAVDISIFFNSTNYNIGLLRRMTKNIKILGLLKFLVFIPALKGISYGIVQIASKIFYLMLILLFMMLIYVLLGMSLLSDIVFFQDFGHSFYSIFGILTYQHWNIIYFVCNE